MKQQDNKSCTAIVGAMAANKSPRYVFIWMRLHRCDGPPFSIVDLNYFLASHKILLGIGANIFNVDIEEDYTIKIEFEVKRFAAVIEVESERFENTEHLIFWNGRQVFDPNPFVEDGRPLTDYNIINWWPIQYEQKGD